MTGIANRGNCSDTGPVSFMFSSVNIIVGDKMPLIVISIALCCVPDEVRFAFHHLRRSRAIAIMRDAGLFYAPREALCICKCKLGHAMQYVFVDRQRLRAKLVGKFAIRDFRHAQTISIYFHLKIARQMLELGWQRR